MHHSQKCFSSSQIFIQVLQYQVLLLKPALRFHAQHKAVFLYLERSFILSFTVKYLGLLAMSKILKTHPKSVQSHKDLILQCLDDKDESIRLRALDLLYGMVCSYIYFLSSSPDPLGRWCLRKTCNFLCQKAEQRLLITTPISFLALRTSKTCGSAWRL